MFGNEPDELKFRSLLQALPQAAAIFQANDPAYTIVAMNDSYRRLLPGRLGEAEGISLVDAIRRGETCFPAASEPGLLGSLKTTALSGAPSSFDTALINVEEGPFRAALLTHTVLLSPAGTRAFVLQSVQLRQPGAFTEFSPDSSIAASFEEAGTGIVLLDADGRVTGINRAIASFLGRKREELLGIELAGLLHPECRDQRQAQFTLLLSGAQACFGMELRYLHADGFVVWAAESVCLRRDKEKVCCIILLEDITQRKQAQKALLQSEALVSMGRLTASIAHELNNPLEAVTNLLFLIGRVDDIEEVHSYALLAEQELERVSKIATQTLRFYKPQSAPAPILITDVIESVLILFEGRIRREKVQVTRRFLPGAQPLIAYSGELRQVFVNLVGNALDAMSDNAKLCVVVRPAKNWSNGAAGMRVIVSDTGSGIPKSLQQKVFEPFVTTKEATGTGLGLWITKDIVKRQGGSLSVRSCTSGPSRGTCMSVFFPYAKKSVETHAA